MSGPADQQRGAELVAALGGLRHRIADACEQAGRDSREITLVAVTKTYSASDVLILTQLGVRDVGESRDQEAAAKVAEVVDSLAQLTSLGEDRPAPRWHFLGQIQSRKCRSIARYAFAVHSLDRSEIADRLADAVRESERPALDVFLQLSLDGDPERGGVAAAEVTALAEMVSAHEELRLRGLMAVAPIGADPDAAFAELQTAAQRLQADYPGADAISAGMSADLEAALRHGATHLRVGSALLGRREPIIR